MSDGQLMERLLDSLKDPMVFVDSEHVIRYMNKAAVVAHEGGLGLIGCSLFDCHNEESKTRILSLFPRLEAGEDEILIVEEPRRRIYMRAVRDESGRLLGYYERYEEDSRSV